MITTEVILHRVAVGSDDDEDRKVDIAEYDFEDRTPEPVERWEERRSGGGGRDGECDGHGLLSTPIKPDVDLEVAAIEVAALEVERNGNSEEYVNVNVKDQDSDDQEPAVKSDSSSTPQKPRQRWSVSETGFLIEGCRNHGVGAWKKILNDPKLVFHNRSAVDLKDRFRTYMPDEYNRLYPNSRRQTSGKRSAVSTMELFGSNFNFERVARRPRQAFTPEEDDELRRGVEKHGCAWAKISKDKELNLTHRRSTDLRDRFRNAFPDYYTQLGYVAKPSKMGKQGEEGNQHHRDRTDDPFFDVGSGSYVTDSLAIATAAVDVNHADVAAAVAAAEAAYWNEELMRHPHLRHAGDPPPLEQFCHKSTQSHTFTGYPLY